MTDLLWSNLCKNIVQKLIWKLIDIFPNQVLNFFSIFIEHGQITAYDTNSVERSSKLLCGNVIIERI